MIEKTPKYLEKKVEYIRENIYKIETAKIKDAIMDVLDWYSCLSHDDQFYYRFLHDTANDALNVLEWCK